MVPEWIMYMPAGKHRITAMRAGKPITLTVLVDPQAAETMQQALQAHTSGDTQRPWMDFDHEARQSAGEPIEFAWREQPAPGVYVRMRWSEPGAKAIQGRAYRSFSPSFFETDDDPARVAGAPRCMGSLVNQPAFRSMRPVMGKASGTQATSNTKDPMTPEELAALQQKLAALEKENAELKAAQTGTEHEEAIAAKDPEIGTLKTELKTAKEAIQAQRSKEAKAAIDAAVARGAIAPKDEATQGRWQKLIEADPANADLLGKQPGRNMSGPITAGAGSDQGGGRVLITAEDTNAVINAYHAEQNPRDRGLIFRRDLSPRIDRGENILARYPIQATNTLGTLVNALVSQRTLELVVSRRPYLANVVMDFSDEVASKGDTVKTRTIGLPTAADFGSSATDTADTDVTITLDQFKQVLYSFTAAEVVGTQRNLVAERSEALALALGNSMVDALAALITEAAFGTANQTITATASVDYSTITAIAKAMNTAGVPDMGRFGWVNAGVAEALRNDELVIANFDRSPIAGAYAHWTNIVGFGNIWEFPALPANSINLTGFFASRSALCVSARVPRNPTEIVGASYPGTIAVVTDPVTGLSVLRNEWIDSSTWAVNSRLVALYGVDVGQASCGHTLVSAA